MATVPLIRAIRRRIQFFPLVIREKRRKSVVKILAELLYLAIIHRTVPSHYFPRRLYLKERKNLRNYLPSRFLYGISEKINDMQASAVLSNKLFFNLYYGRFLDRLPLVLCHNHRKMFVINNENYEISTAEEFESLLNDLVLHHSKKGSVFIKKTYDSYGGMNTFRITRDDLPLQPEALKKMYASIASSAFLFQETITQHPLLDRINPSCINSIRMDSFVNADGTPEVLSAFLRMSISNSHIDNISSGGCYVGIDINKGTLMRDGYSFITVTGGQMYTQHPVTGTVFEGYQLPYFDEVKELVCSAARLVPSLRLIGWDIAITENGPLLIEGNAGYDITGHDMISAGYRAHPVFRKVIREINAKRYMN